MYFSPKAGGITCLEGSLDSAFDDNTITEMLSGPVFLASDAALRLIDRGFGTLLGVDVRDWTGSRPSREILPFRNNPANVQVRYKELVPLSADVLENSTVYHTVDGVQMEKLFPGSTIYKNKKGGTVFTFCGPPEPTTIWWKPSVS